MRSLSVPRTLVTLFGASTLVAAAMLSHAQVEKTPAPEGAKVYIISPEDGATVPATFTVVFGLEGMGVAPAGTQTANTGHHHLLVDGESPDMNAALGAQVTHFGGGQTQTTLTLEPGEHTLQLILGDHLHVPHNPPVVSDQITITVR